MQKRHPALISLSHNHHRGLVLAQRLKAGTPLHPQEPDNDLRTRITFLQKFFVEHLRPHFAAEEEILFPLVSPSPPAVQPLVRRLVQEHRALEQLTEKLIGSEKTDTEAALSEFGSMLESHIHTEERELFPAIENNGSEELLTMIAARIREYEKRHGT
jgi:hemerythrin-like domain-containing protein